MFGLLANNIKDEVISSRRSKIFESRPHPLTERETSEKFPSRQLRKTFFDFGQE